MDDRICTIQDCGRPLVCRGLCNAHYIRAWKSGGLPPRDFGDWHVLTDIDRDARTGMCARCGAVRVKLRKNGGAECQTKRRESAKSRRLNADPSKPGGKKVWDQRRYALRTKYGLTVDQYDRMLAAQMGRCAI